MTLYVNAKVTQGESQWGRDALAEEEDNLEAKMKKLNNRGQIHPGDGGMHGGFEKRRTEGPDLRTLTGI